MTREWARKNKASIFNASFSTGVADIRERSHLLVQRSMRTICLTPSSQWQRIHRNRPTLSASWDTRDEDSGWIMLVPWEQVRRWACSESCCTFPKHTATTADYMNLRDSQSSTRVSWGIAHVQAIRDTGRESRLADRWMLFRTNWEINIDKALSLCTNRQMTILQLLEDELEKTWILCGSIMKMGFSLEWANI